METKKQQRDNWRKKKIENAELGENKIKKISLKHFSLENFQLEKFSALLLDVN